MKKIFLTILALVHLMVAQGQGIMTPERIHIGDTSFFPSYSDGPVKIYAPGNSSYGILLLKNPVSNLCTAADFYNNKNLRLTVGIAGSENPNFYRNCGYLFMSDQNGDEPAGGLVIGHRYSSAPIIFAQNNEEVVRISAEGNIGIGTSTPEVPLRIEADVPDGNGRALIRLRNTSYASTASVSYGLESNDGTSGSTFTHTSTSFTAIPDFDNFSVIAANGKGFAVYTTKPYSSIRFYTNIDDNGIIERMRITGEGNVGIGIKTPSYKLDVAGLINTSEGIRFPDGTIQTSASSSSYWQTFYSGSIFTNDKVGIGTNSPKTRVEVADGDIFISDINKGIIMKSPDGRCWKGTLDIMGKLNFVIVNCEDLNVNNLNTIEDTPSIIIYPNPVKNTVTIACKHSSYKNMNAILYSEDGKIVKREKLPSDYSVLQLNDIPQGTYIIRVVNKKGDEIGSEKIIKN
jgi:hypothetical protein